MIIGNTVRIVHTFKSWADEAVDVTSPTIIIYEGEVAGTPLATINLTPAEKIATGTYQYYYLVPVPVAFPDLIFEFSGVAEGKPEVTRITEHRTYV